MSIPTIRPYGKHAPKWPQPPDPDRSRLPGTYHRQARGSAVPRQSGRRSRLTRVALRTPVLEISKLTFGKVNLCPWFPSNPGPS